MLVTAPRVDHKTIFAFSVESLSRVTDVYAPGKYAGYAHECMRLAGQANNENDRGRLLQLAADFYKVAAAEEYSLARKKRVNPRVILHRSSQRA